MCSGVPGSFQERIILVPRIIVINQSFSLGIYFSSALYEAKGFRYSDVKGNMGLHLLSFYPIDYKQCPRVVMNQIIVE